MSKSVPAENTIAWVYVYNREPFMEAWEELQWRDGNWRDSQGDIKFDQLEGIEFIEWIPVWSKHRGEHLQKSPISPTRNHALFRAVNGKRYVSTSTLMGFKYDLINHGDRKRFREANFRRKNRYQTHRQIRPWVWRTRVSHTATVLNQSFMVKVRTAKDFNND